jgi:hypothetical protein
VAKLSRLEEVVRQMVVHLLQLEHQHQQIKFVAYQLVNIPKQVIIMLWLLDIKLKQMDQIQSLLVMGQSHQQFVQFQ